MSKNDVWDVVVIGGGPAGMMAAGRASEKGKKVLLLEKNPGLGKKLLITGGGRCNVTNNKPDVRILLAKYKESDKFLFSAFSQFGVPDAKRFFKDRGMDMKEENEGRMFPVSNKAKSVWDVLVKYVKDGGVEIKQNAEVTKIIFNKDKNEFEISFSGLAAKRNGIIKTKTCILATGGKSHPETGSTGEGFKWLKNLGHKVVDDGMALVPIALKDTWVKRVSGVSLAEARLTTYRNGKKQKAYKGKVLFTHFGISGPAVLNMSKDVGVLLNSGEGKDYYGGQSEVVIMLDLFPGLDNFVLKNRLQKILIENSNKKIKNSLFKLVAPALVSQILALTEIDPETPNHSVRTEERKKLVNLLKATPLNVLGLLGKDKAVVSSGGVELAEVDFKTMQSRIVPNLYLVGDVLNIDRPSGGYSLQLCWTTGFVAGDHV